MKEHRLTVVVNGADIQAVYVDVSDSNIDGTLRLYDAGLCLVEYPPGEWTEIDLIEVAYG